ncbi:D-tagatose-bisphosphate aldolase, class II, non-catalytic subunit [Silvibacterium sp.]|uniref:D-tagatose-bisphosphate aldolase, class II, non-catalytic subunit n=1 Tax=Silvibacterium sp. TaxID=1964179 RepID=UPI0039E52D4C
MHRLQKLFSRKGSGIYSVCSAHPWVIEASVEQALEDGSLLLVEATCNQVNQFGGYTGMTPADFRKFVTDVATKSGLAEERLILGGDHLGPNPWKSLPAEEAMKNAEAMVKAYVKAGFTKIHLDASMSCADDPTPLPPDVIAHRAIRLAKVAEAAREGGEAPVYIVGTEVPTPGGATHSLDVLVPTHASDAEHTWQIHRELFDTSENGDLWSRVLGLVVQPGVEFGHDGVVEYDRAKAAELVASLQKPGGPTVFEAHSTDYQLPQAFVALVEDDFGILKVGPALTFALREALFELEEIEQLLVPAGSCSHLRETLEQVMLDEPADWKSHYHGTPEEQKLLRAYSYSDRIRYYWNRPAAERSVSLLVQNLEARVIPETLISQYLPLQYAKLRAGAIDSHPVALIRDHIREVLRQYARACRE